MTVEEKKALRISKLKELYDENERTGGRDVTIQYSNLRENENEKQEHLALEYLADKGYINYKIRANNFYQAKITSFGIDYVESEK